MIKRILTALCLSLSFVGIAHGQSADIRFAVSPVDGEVSSKVGKILVERIEQGISRSNALSENPFEVFSVRPVVIIEDILQTEGMVREVAVIKGELRLSAVNDIDGTTYHSVTIPLKATALDGEDKAMEKLALSVKPTDPVFVRFIRQSRQKIEEYYADNCSKIVAVAKQLADTGRGKEALSYLAGVSPSVDCYDIASVMILDISSTTMPQTPEIADINNEPVEPETIVVKDTVYVDRIVEIPAQPSVPVTSEAKPTPKPQRDYSIPGAPQSAMKPAKQRPDENLSPEIIIDSDQLKVKVVSCRGDETTRRINIVLEVVNLDRRYDKAYVFVSKAFDSNGIEITDTKVKNSNGNWLSGANLNLPYEIPVKMNVFLSGFDNKINKLSFVELEIRGIKVSIKNLSVSW